MIKKLFSILFLYMSLSCISTKVEKGDVLYENLDSMDYSEIFYSFENSREFNSKTGLNFRKNNGDVLDSIFQVNSEKYKIRKKVYIPEELSSVILKDLASESDKGSTSLKDKEIPVDISSVLKSDTKFVLIPYIRPSLELIESYSNQNTIVITNPSFNVKSFELKLFIIDVSQNSISFYGAKKAKRKKNLSYGHNMLISLNEILRDFTN